MGFKSAETTNARCIRLSRAASAAFALRTAAADCFTVGFLNGTFFFLLVAGFFAVEALGAADFAGASCVVGADLGEETGVSCPVSDKQTSATADATRKLRMEI